MARRSCKELALLLAIALLFLTVVPLDLTVGQARGAGTVVTESIYANTTWTVGNSPYFVTEAITVNKGYTLVIEQGVTVKFDHWVELTIEGTLKTTGKVIFTSNNSAPVAGEWDGIIFDGADQRNSALTNIEIHYASTGIALTDTTLTLSGAHVDFFTRSALDINTGSTAIVTGSVFVSSSFATDGIDCESVLQLTGSTVAANTGIHAKEGCTGLVDKSIITTFSSYGVQGDSGASLTVQNSLINSTEPDWSNGVYANDGSKLNIKGDDIVGHETGIYWDTAFGTVDNVSVRNCFSLAIEADTNVRVTNSFVGSPSPRTGSYWDSDINDKVTIVDPAGAPFDLPGIPQPPTVYIKKPAPEEKVSGKVSIEGQAWDPDPGDSISSIEVRVYDSDSNTIWGWTKCDGTTSWKCTWDTSSIGIVEYFISARVISGKDSVLSMRQLVVVNNDGGTDPNITDPFGWYGVYMMVCIGAVVGIVVVIIIVVVVFFVIRGKKKATPPQPAYPQQYPAAYPTYPSAPVYQPPPQQAAPVQPEPPKPAVAEEFVIEDVFLIYKDGRLIHHDTRRLKPEVDDQMLGGMFTAIQEFIGQSFPAEDGTKGQIKEITYGDSRVILEHGNWVYLAVVASDIKDTKPLHARMENLIKGIESRCATTLTSWDGNMESVSDAKRMVKLIYSNEDIDKFVI